MIAGPGRALAMRRDTVRNAYACATVAALAVTYAAAGAPTPLYVVYETRWHLPPWLATLAFAIYAAGLIVGLLFNGSLADRVGRRPVIMGAFVMLLAGMLLLAFAGSIGIVLLGRALQGWATGVLTSALVAVAAELASERRRTLIQRVAAGAGPAGLATGIIAAGLAASHSSTPDLVLFGMLAVLCAACVVVAVVMPETADHRPGALRSLIPRVAIPARARAVFGAMVPGQVATWMYGGLVLGLVPSIVAESAHIHDPTVQGLVAAVQPAVSALTAFFIGRFSARRQLLVGVLGSTGGLLLIGLGALSGQAAWLVAAGVIGGIGFGGSLGGMIAGLVPAVETHERSGVLAAMYLIAYAAFGAPVLIAGIAFPWLGFLPTILVFVVAGVALGAIGLAVQLRAPKAVLSSGLTEAGLPSEANR